MERWIKYKDTILNVSQIQRLTVDKISMSKNRDAVAHYYPADLKPTKQKPWVLIAGHEGIDVFASKADALKVAEDIVTGRYDIK